MKRQRLLAIGERTAAWIKKPQVKLLGYLLLGIGILLLGSALVSGLDGRAVKDGNIVRVNYTLTLEDGKVFFTSDERDPVRYTLGEGRLLPAFEAALIGMRVGESKTITVSPENAYGPYRHELIMTVDRSKLPEGSQPAVGQQLQTKTEAGNPLMMVITEVTDDTVTLDANHTLAGRTLTFGIELVGIEANLVPGDRIIQIRLSWLVLALVVLVAGLSGFYVRRRRRSPAQVPTVY